MENLLRFYPCIGRQIKQLELSLRQLSINDRDEIIYSLVVGNKALTGMPFPSVGNTSDKTAKVALNYTELIKNTNNKAIVEVIREIEFLNNTMEKIELALEGLPTLWKKTIEGKYFSEPEKTWSEIEKDCKRKIEKRTLQKYRKNAVSRIQKNLRMPESIYVKVYSLLKGD